MYGLEKFWAFLKYTRKRALDIDPELKGTLENFKTLEDFRVLVSRWESMPHMAFKPLTHSDPLYDLELLGGQVVKTSALA